MAVPRKCPETTVSVVCLHSRYPLTSGFDMYPPFHMLTVRNDESHSLAGSPRVPFTCLLSFSSSSTTLPFYGQTDWLIAILIEGRRRVM